MEEQRGKFCRFCGAKIPFDSRFCELCGSKLDPDSRVQKEIVRGPGGWSIAKGSRYIFIENVVAAAELNPKKNLTHTSYST